jgi:hypothetical protein
MRGHFVGIPTMTRQIDFCTYFDSRYLSRALALYSSLRRHAPWARLHALCMDNLAFDTLMRLGLPGIGPIRLNDFEDGDEALLTAKSNRSLVEYYFTCSPSLPLYILGRHPEIERILYIDADCYFFSSAEAILDDWGDGSVYIVGHRYPESLRALEKYGKFNVGIIGFRNNAEGRLCLERWRSQCNDWCYDRIEAGKFADQKYLDAWPNSYSGTVVAQHVGVNVAPWNTMRYHLEERDGVPFGNEVPIVCYHFHSLKLYPLGLVVPQSPDYGTRLNRDWIRLIYTPYLRQISRMETAYGLGHQGDLRYGRPLSLSDLTTVGSQWQFLVHAASQCREVAPYLLETLRHFRRGAAAVRNAIKKIGSGHRSADANDSHDQSSREAGDWSRGFRDEQEAGNSIHLRDDVSRRARTVGQARP